jgi:beta-glucosidase-like glycosyl hydrolase
LHSNLEAEDFMEISKIFKIFNLDTPLGPVVDMPLKATNDDINKITQYGLNAAKYLFSSNLIPTFKHFIYHDSLGDTHNTTSIDERSFVDIAREMKPYFKIDGLNKPYFIMTSHQILNAIDDVNPVTSSTIALKFIHDNFRNSVVLADEISMAGFSNSHSLSHRVKNVKSDIFIVHSGILDFNYRRYQLYDGLYQRKSDVEDLDSIIRVLKLKLFYKKLSIQEIN